MTTTEAALRDALEKMTEAEKTCPANIRSLGSADCPKCGASSSQNCGQQAGAAFAVVAAARALSQPPASSPVGEVRLWPDIGPDPMKGPREPDQNEKATERVEHAYVIQQKEVPDQTALVWRWDIGRLLMDYKRLRAWQESQREKVIDPNVRKLVIAAREAWEVDCVSGDDLDKALEPFAALVPYENEPDREALSPLSGEPASVAPTLAAAVERFLADYDDGDRADAGTNPLMAAHIADFRAAISAPASVAGETDNA